MPLAPRIVPDLEKMPRAVELGCTAGGRLLMVAIFTSLLLATWSTSAWQTGAVLVLTSAVPSMRRTWLMLAAVAWALQWPALDPLILDIARAHGAQAWVGWWPVLLPVAWLLLWTLAAIRPRRPLVVLLAIVFLLQAADRSPIGGVAALANAALAMVLARHVWFFAYALQGRPQFPTELGFFRPFWGFTTVPYGKGSAYLARFEARTEHDLAISQLKGLKLMMWATVLYVVQVLLAELVQGSQTGPLSQLAGGAVGPLVPTYPEALSRQLGPDPYPLHVRWLALCVQFARNILELTVSGHVIVATCRMAGFNILRNTYKPLAATTIAEFYNRVYFYFKELLVDFFFYPAYLRWFKAWPRLRLFAATMASAGFGNFLFHFLKTDRHIFIEGLPGALWSYRAYALYTLILGVAIGLSQLRGRRARGPFAIAGVLLFYCLMTIIDEPDRHHSLGDYGTFLLSLFHP